MQPTTPVFSFHRLTLSTGPKRGGGFGNQPAHAPHPAIQGHSWSVARGNEPQPDAIQGVVDATGPTFPTRPREVSDTIALLGILGSA